MDHLSCPGRKHVLREKPLALTVEEVDAIVAAARAEMEENGIEFIRPIERDTDDYK